MNTHEKNTNLENLLEKTRIIKEQIENLNSELNILHKKQLEYNILICKEDVANLNKDDVLNEIETTIKNNLKAFNNNDCYDTHRLYADGTIEYCRNVYRGNWHEIFKKLFNDVPDQLNILFPEKLTNGKDRYVTLTFDNTIEIRKKLTLLKKIYDYK